MLNLLTFRYLFCLSTSLMRYQVNRHCALKAPQTNIVIIIYYLLIDHNMELCFDSNFCLTDHC